MGVYQKLSQSISELFQKIFEFFRRSIEAHWELRHFFGDFKELLDKQLSSIQVSFA